ncbi:hypothetical protein LINPERHAP2_LOCUS9679, partial [Linum perenne]
RLLELNSQVQLRALSVRENLVCESSLSNWTPFVQLSFSRKPAARNTNMLALWRDFELS